MPKKTKRQKLLADQRRHIKVPLVSPMSHQEIKTNTSSFTFHLKEASNQSKDRQKANDQDELMVVKKDLTRTILFAVIAIAIELGVYSVLRGT